MTSITLTSQAPATATPPSIGSALRELAVASRHLVVALLSTFQRSRSASRRQLSALEEAENLRALADTWVKTDPSFAGDLYAAADRHELAHGA